MTIQEIQDVYDNRMLYSNEIATVVKQHERMMFYFTFTGRDMLAGNVTDKDYEQFRDSYQHFANVARVLNSADKYKRYCQLFINPIPEMAALVIPELQAATQAIDRYIYVEFASDASQQGFDKFLKTSNVEEFFNENAIYKTMIAPSCILIVEPDENGVPFMWQPSPAQIKAYLIDDNGNFEVLILQARSGNTIVYCNEYYRLFDKTDTNLSSPIFESAHGLGYCPAAFLWDVPLLDANNLPRRTAALAAENTLDAFIMHETSRQHLELYGKYPIVTRIAEKCEVTKFGKRCNGQYFEFQDEFGNWTKTPCTCQRSQFIGAGTEIQVTLPENETQLPDVVKLIGADVNTLEFNAARTDEYKQKIYAILAGGNPEGFNNKAINEKQLEGIFEQKRKIVTQYARTLEKAHAFVLKTMAKLLYTDFVSVTVDYGTQFQLVTKAALLEELKQARATGAGMSKILSLRSQITTSEAKTMSEAKRLSFIDMLSDYPTLTTAELLALKNAGVINNTILQYHLSLPTLIARYEREQGQISGDENLQSVKDIMYNYLTPMQNEQESINQQQQQQFNWQPE